MSSVSADKQPVGKSRPTDPNEDLIPLLIASSKTGLVLNYNRMAALDPHHRTYAALEHKYRKFKARAKEILEAEHGNHTGGGNISVEKTKAKNRKSKRDAAEDESDGGELSSPKKPKVTKRAPAKASGQAEVPKKRAAAKTGIKNENLDNEANLTAVKKEAKSPDEEDVGANYEAITGKKRDEATAKPPKFHRKGVAMVVRKSPVRPGEETVTEEDSESEDGDEDEQTGKPKPKGKAGGKSQ